MEVEGAMGNGALEATAPADEASFAIPPPQPSEQNGGAEKMDTDSFAATLPAGGYSTVGAAEEVAVNPLLEKHNEYWKCVRENPGDFATWTYLLSTVEKLEDLPKIREAYDAFLAEYPLCYGYWKKYADAEFRYAGAETACEVYNRGVQSVPYSVDLWCHCVTYQQSNMKASADEIRRYFEQGLAYVGSDFLSHALWDKYLNFEAAEGHVLGQAQLYSRILGCPIKELNRYYQSFKEFVAQHAATDLMTEAEMASFRSQVEQKKSETKISGSSTTAPTPTTLSSTIPQEAPPPDPSPEAEDERMAESNSPEADPVAETGDTIPEESTEVDASGEENVEKQNHDPMDLEPCPPGAEVETVDVSLEEIKEAWVKSRCSFYLTASKELQQRKPFEECIKRPYFHTKPLDSVQLQAWLQYLDYMESLQEASAETITVYERCLVACACYPEFWKRYVRYMEKRDVDRSRGILDRATVVHCKLKAEIHLFAAHFEERHDNAEKARQHFVHVQTTLAPRLISMIIQFANFERRQGNLEAACAIYEECIQEELSKDTSESCAFLTIQYAHFLNQVVGDYKRGRAIIDKALGHKPNLKALWEGAIHYEEGILKEDSIQRIRELYEKCTSPPENLEASLSEVDREELGLHYIEFCDMHCDATKWASVESAHAHQFPSVVGVSESRKRAAVADQETAPAKAARTDAYAGMQTVQPVHPGNAAAQVPQVPIQAQSYYQAQPTVAAAHQYAQQYAQYYGYLGYGYTGYGY